MTVPAPMLKLLGLPPDADDQTAIDELMGVVAEAALWKKLIRDGTTPASTRCDDVDDVIVEEMPAHCYPPIFVARCCHGTTSQGDSREHAVRMALEACATAHEHPR